MTPSTTFKAAISVIFSALSSVHCLVRLCMNLSLFTFFSYSFGPGNLPLENTGRTFGLRAIQWSFQGAYGCSRESSGPSAVPSSNHIRFSGSSALVNPSFLKSVSRVGVYDAWLIVILPGLRWQSCTQPARRSDLLSGTWLNFFHQSLQQAMMFFAFIDKASGMDVFSSSLRSAAFRCRTFKQVAVRY